MTATRFTRRALVGATAVVLSLLATAGAIAAEAPSDTAAILAVDQAWLKAYNGGDAKAIAALYEENAVLLAPGSRAVTGRAAIQAWFAKDTAESAKAGVVFFLDPKPVAGSNGNLGWASGTYTVKDKAGKVIDTGKYLSVSVKKDGHWYYLRDTWNSDVAH